MGRISEQTLLKREIKSKQTLCLIKCWAGTIPNGHMDEQTLYKGYQKQTKTIIGYQMLSLISIASER